MTPIDGCCLFEGQTRVFTLLCLMMVFSITPFHQVWQGVWGWTRLRWLRGMRRAQSQTRASSLLIKPWTFTIHSRYENLISSHLIVPLNPFATICRYDIPPTARRLRTTCLIGAQSFSEDPQKGFFFLAPRLQTFKWMSPQSSNQLETHRVKTSSCQQPQWQYSDTGALWVISPPASICLSFTCNFHLDSNAPWRLSLTNQTTSLEHRLRIDASCTYATQLAITPHLVIHLTYISSSNEKLFNWNAFFFFFFMLSAFH